MSISFLMLFTQVSSFTKDLSNFKTPLHLEPLELLCSLETDYKTGELSVTIALKGKLKAVEYKNIVKPSFNKIF